MFATDIFKLNKKENINFSQILNLHFVRKAFFSLHLYKRLKNYAFRGLVLAILA